MSYPIYPNSGPGAPKSSEGTPGTRHVPATPASGRPYPTYGYASGGECEVEPPEVESSTGTSLHGEPQAGKHVNPYPVHGLQYALDKVMAAKNVTHFQSGDIRHADDMSGGNPIERANPGPVAAVSAALDARLNSRKPMTESQDQKSAFKRAAKGAKAGRPANDMKLRHAGTQADVNSASTGY